MDKEIIVVDDCSTDATSAVVADVPGVRLHRMARNGGKGQAVRAGIERATGDYLIIQDADLEYNPQDYVPMMRALLAGRADVIYGSRYLGRGRHANQSLAAFVGGRSLSLVMLACTGQYLTDTVTALKLFPRALLAELQLETDRLRNRPRDHREGARARAADRGGAGTVLPAEQGRRQEDRAARLVHCGEDVLAVQKRLVPWQPRSVAGFPGGASRIPASLLPQVLPVFSIVAPGHSGAARRAFGNEPRLPGD